VTLCLPDLVSDFSVFHRVDDVGAMPSATFFALAPRLSAYQGAMRARVAAEMAEEEDQEGPGVPVPQMPPPVAADGRPVNMVGGSRAELQMEPSFAGIFSFGQAASG
jgi:hypothetical protein